MKLDFRGWNERQKVLRHNLAKGLYFRETLELFLEQHAMVHSSEMTDSIYESFEDKIWVNLTEESFRRIPGTEEYSIAWVIWHIARIEDITMNMLVAGTPQLAYVDTWLPRIKSPFVDTGNAMDIESVRQLSASVDNEVLRAYRIAVGRRTREIVQQLKVEDLQRKVSPVHIQLVMDQGAVVPEAWGITDYWANRTIAGLLLMPPTRHNMIHINQALRIKKRRS